MDEQLKQALAEFKTAVLEEVKGLLKDSNVDEENVEEADGVENKEVTEAEQKLVSIEAMLLEVRRANRAAEIKSKLLESGLPKPVIGKIEERLLETLKRRDVEDSEINAEIEFARTLIKESGRANPNFAAGSVRMGDAAVDQKVKALQGWFQGQMIDGVRPIRDLRESYADWNGLNYLDADPYEMFSSFCTKYDSGRHHSKLQESLGTADWGQVFADVFYLQMIQSYKASPDYDKWRLITSDIESVPDFRTRHWTRIGGYADFSTVAERATYPTLTSPGDEEVTYAVQKYGGIDDISMEMILGDRLGQVRRLPQLMAYAAARTLYKFVFDLVTTSNPTMDYDATPLYHANHGNTGTTALSVSGLDAVVVAMRSQTAFGQSQEILGTRNAPKLIIVPNELEGRVKRILNPSEAYTAAIAANWDTDTGMDPQRFKDSNIGYHVYDQLTDANDWWVVADPAMVPTLVVGFLNGRQEPELFTQDQPNVGSTFSADKISYKLRFVFGGDVLEHRSFYRQVVA